MQSLNEIDARRVVQLLPRVVRENLLHDAEQSSKVFLGGGFIREIISGGDPRDIDLFVDSRESAHKLRDKLRTDVDQSFKTDNAITIVRPVGLPIQIITRWLYSDAQSLADSFDFTVCKCVLWREGGEWKSLVSDDFYADLAAKRLRYTSPEREEESGGSMLRALRFNKRGYHIPPEELAKVIARLVGDDTKCEDIRVRLREVDPLRLLAGEFVND